MTVRILTGDCRAMLRDLPDESVHCVVTSPPYWGLRDYGVDGQLGMEKTLGEYVETMVSVFREVRRVLRSDGTLWLNLGDSYAASPSGRKAADIVNDDRTFRDKPFSTIGAIYDSSHEKTARSGKTQNQGHVASAHGGRIMANGYLKPKDLCGIPWRVAFALQADGWWLRQDIIWSKPNPMPESVADRCTKAHEYIFLLSKSERYYYDADAIKEKTEARYEWTTQPYKEGDLTIHHRASNPKKFDEWGLRNKRSVWEIATAPFSEAHFATFPPALIEPCILAGCPQDCCSKCGTSWMRQTDGATYYDGALVGSDPQRKYGDREYGRGPKNNLGASIAKTISWRPCCSCNAETVAGTVLDPFGGAGTTGLVTDRLRRNAILIELNLAYAAMAARRIKDDAGMFASITTDWDSMWEKPFDLTASERNEKESENG